MLHLQQYVVILCAALSSMMTVPATAQSTLSLTSASGHPGDEVEVSVMLGNAQFATAMQVTIPHTPYVSYVDGSAVLNRQRVSDTHSITVSDNDNLLSLYVYDMSLNTFKEGTDAFITLRLKLDKEPGTYEFKPEVVLSDISGNPLSVSVIGGKVTILSPKIALNVTEVNYGSVPIRSSHQKTLTVSNIGNEILTVTDVQSTSTLFKVSPTTTSIEAGQQQTLTIEYNPQESGTDVADITLISNAVNGNQNIHVTATPFSVNTLTVADAAGQAGEQITVSVSMQNMEAIVAVQCCFTLPDALQYVEGSATLSERVSGGSHQLSATEKDGKLAFYIHSSSNKALSSNTGDLFTFKLLLNGGGSYTLQPEEVILSNASGIDMTSDVKGGNIRIAAPKLECSTTLDFGRIPVEEVIKKRYMVRNGGESPLTIQRIDFSDEKFSLTDSNLPTIAAGHAVEIEVCYRLSGPGTFTGVMQLYCNDPQNPMQAVEIKGDTYYTNEITLNGQTVSNNANQYALTISLENTLPIVAMQFDIHWITGMAPVKEMASMSARASGHQVDITKLSDDTYRVYLYSLNNAPINPGKGPVATIIYNKVNGMVDYNHTVISANQVILSTKDGENCASSSTAELNIGGLSGLMGDANNDGQVNVTDITCIVNYLLEIDSTGFVMSQADMNQDQRITITDAVELIYAILHQ